MTIAFVRLTGDAFECGRQHGLARAAPLREFIDDGLCRLNRIAPNPLSLESLRPALSAYRAKIDAATPLLAEEIAGLADGAGIVQDEALLLQLRREVLGYQRVPTLGDCTTYARAGDVLAQTIDLNGNLDDQIAVLDVARSGSPRRVLVLSFAGLLGYLGVNSDGLAVGLNLVLGGAWRPGVPPYLAIRHLLDSAASVDEAVDILRSLQLASSRSLTLCDGEKAAFVEIFGDELRVAEAGETVHTNHFLDPDLAPHDALNVFARNFSLQRLEACRSRLAGLALEGGAEEHLDLLSTAPICVESDGDIRRERTVAAVAMFPGHGELHVRPGDPSRSQTRSFSLRARVHV